MSLECRPRMRLLFVVVVAFAICSAAPLVSAQEAATDAKTALDAFKRRYKAKEIGERLASLQILAPYPSTEALREVKHVLADDIALPVKTAAIGLFEHWGSAEAARALLAGCDGTKLPDICLDSAGRALGRFYDDEARSAVRQVTQAASRDLRYVATRALAGYEQASDLGTLQERLGDGDGGVRTQAALALIALGPAARPALPDVLTRAATEKDWRARAAMIELLGRNAHPGAETLLATLAEDSDTLVACSALRWLGAFPDQIERLAANLAHKEYPRGVAATRGLWQTRDNAAVPALFGALDGLHPRVQGEILYVLERLTRKQIGAYPDAWRGWWESEKKEGLELDWEAPYSDRPEDDPWGADAASGEDTVSFFGLELRTRSVVFIMDTSRSMLGFTQSDEFKQDDGKVDHRPYLERVKEELVKAIRKLPNDSRFNIYFFDSQTRKIFKSMTPASRANQDKAIKIVESQQAAGAGTNFYDAFKEIWDDTEEIDTIVFLTEGVPTEGKITDALELRDWILDHNRLRLATIHTISVGYPTEALSLFMRDLAAETGGRFVQR